MTWSIRLEREGDEADIAALTTAAFREAPHKSGTEAAIVERLRLHGDLALSRTLTERSPATWLFRR